MEAEIKHEPVIIDGYELVDAGFYNDSSLNQGRANVASSPKKPQQIDKAVQDIYVPSETEFPNEEMQLLLHQWGLEILADRFTQNLIDVSLLDYILDVDIIDLCKDLPMRYRLILRRNLQQKCYKRQTGVTDSSEADDCERPLRNRETLVEICQWHESGRKFLEQYRIENGKRIYSADSRKYIKTALVEYFFKSGKGRITDQNFTTMVQIILDELPDEDPRIWYIPPSGGLTAGGLLFARYKYLMPKNKQFHVQKSDPVVPHATAVFKQEERHWKGLSKEAQLDCSVATDSSEADGRYNNKTDVHATGDPTIKLNACREPSPQLVVPYSELTVPAQSDPKSKQNVNMTAILHDYPDCERPLRNRETLVEICQWHESGRKFLEQYRIENGKRIYSADSRKYIKTALVEYFFKSGKGRITDQNFTTMVQIILDELPDEDPRIWYIPPSGGLTAGGLLFARYKYLMPKNKQFHVQKSDPVVPHATAVFKQEERHWKGLSKEAQLDCSVAKRKLKKCSNMNRADIITAWKDSFPLRRYEAVTKTIRLEEWEVLASYEDITELISYDFCAMHSIEHDCIRDRITTFVTRFKDVYHGYKMLVDDDKWLSTALFSTFGNHFEICDNSIFLAFYTLPLILRQRSIPMCKTRIKPSLKLCRDAFIVLLETEAGITEVIAQHKQTFHQEETGTLLPPFIIAVGNTRSHKVNEYFVILDSTIFKCKTAVDAVDLLFKLYVVFHIEYAYGCASVLRFIQQHFYNLIHEGTRQDASVAALITDLNRSLN
ncbi:uncharacterized protein LOC131690187 isoform X2 [Topomyia yanbarensis]|uniref:uncharacterized protein LOC131690187 isoform X2 n=1 Tax=Topomyia yanbarensis TaxID=2498891 RepID=UPI00273C51EE|nr:uncharacterized protein LOC131690187 isoform X2 [Topomyia yanbarensis]